MTVAHLHVHSEYSLLDGAASPQALAEQAARLEQPALGLTDHGVMSGTIEHYKACRSQGIKPIIGCEIYLVDDHRKRVGDPHRRHLTLLAENDAGYRNLLALSSDGFLHGLHQGKPGVDLTQLAHRAEGIIALTGCISGPVAHHLLAEDPLQAAEAADTLSNIFGPENVYFELQHNGLKDQQIVNTGIRKLAKQASGRLCATADVHYLRAQDYQAHAALLCVQTKSTLKKPSLRFESNEFYLKSSEEMASAFREDPTAIDATLQIAERCNVEIALGGQHLPRFLADGQDETQHLRNHVQTGLAKRYGTPIPAEAQRRADYELEVIDRMGFNAYFLIVWDFVKWARDNRIAVGPGRGSAAGSIVSYALCITGICPLEHQLLFERFLNPERVSMPDIDIDFSITGRQKVIDYVTGRYGQQHVAQICTFGRMLPKQATRDAARVLGHPASTANSLAKLIGDPQQGRTPTFNELTAQTEPLGKRIAEDPVSRQIIGLAQALEGTVRNSSVHAAAVVISPCPLVEIVPLAVSEDRAGNQKTFRQVTQYSMKPVEELGLLKMDFLGLRNLDVIEAALDIIERSTGNRPDLETLGVGDPATYRMLQAGDSTGVFQFESDGMRDALQKVKPTRFEDLVALVALYRPGAMAQIPLYAKGKEDPSAVVYRDRRLQLILSGTYGVILYQEQAMQIAKELAGFTASQADDLRKAIGKKDRPAMDGLEQAFRDGCTENEVSDDVARWLWETNKRSADYSFNKSHAACYALIAYRTAWLKANHPAAYMAAVISSVMDTKDKVPFFLSRCRQMGLSVLGPDVSLSEHGFLAGSDSVRFGLGAIKSIGPAIADAIIEGRHTHGPYTSIWEFCDRLGNTLTKAHLHALIGSGALDSTGDSRKGMLEISAYALSAGQHPEAETTATLFDGIEDPPTCWPNVPEDEFTSQQLLAQEKDATGIFLSSHPVETAATELRSAGCTQAADLQQLEDGALVTVGGIVTETRRHKARSGSHMMFVTIDDLTADITCMFFERELEQAEAICQVDRLVTIAGRLSNDDLGLTIKANHAAPLKQPQAKEPARATTVKITIDAAERPMTEQLISQLRDLLKDHQGPAPLALSVVSPTGTVHLKSSITVAATVQLVQAAGALAGITATLQSGKPAATTGT